MDDAGMYKCIQRNNSNFVVSSTQVIVFGKSHTFLSRTYSYIYLCSLGSSALYYTWLIVHLY